MSPPYITGSEKNEMAENREIRNTAEPAKPMFYGGILLLVVLLLAVSLLPILAIGRYDVQATDDYSFGAATHQTFLQTGNVFLTLRTGWEQVKSSYLTWQGTWAAIFLMTLQPGVFQFEAYSITAVIMLSSLILGIFTLTVILLTDVFRMNQMFSAIVATAISFLCVQLVPSPVEAFYWYNGAIYYTFFHGLAMLSYALMIRYVIRGGKGRLFLLTAIQLFLGGGNYPTALCTIILFLGVIFLLVLEKKQWQRLVLPLTVLAVSFAVNLSAPGNTVRMTMLDGGQSVTGAVSASFQAGWRYSIRWFSLPVVGTMLSLASLYVDIKKTSGFRFPHPWFVTLFSYCLMSAMFCPTIYTMGNTGPQRLIDIIFYTYIFLLTINTLYWTGWLFRDKDELKFRKWIAPVAAAVCISLFSMHLRDGAYTSTIAMGELHSGVAEMYYQAHKDRLVILEDPEIRDAVLDPLPAAPYLLFRRDLSEQAEEDYVNLSMAQFYQKDSVILKTEKTEER